MPRRIFYRGGQGGVSARAARGGIAPAGSLSGAGLNAVSLTEDPSANLANPERGFFTYTETHRLANDTGYVPLDATAIAADRTSLGRTIVFRYQYMEKYRTLDNIDQDYLDQLADDLAAARDAGVKLVIRFAYSDSGTTSPYNSDTTPTRVVGHIEQLAPVLNDYADIIFALESGFVGTWGEQYYSDNFGSNPSQPWVLNSTDWTNRQNVLNALLRNLDSRIFILLRYPGIREHFYPHPSTHRDLKRLGVHNDGFLAPDEDYGTYTTFSGMSVADTRAYIAFETAAHAVPNGGESAAVNAPTSEWTNALAELEARRFVFLSPLWHPDVLASWGSNVDIAKRRLGYRLVADEVRSQATIARGGKLRVELDVTNGGFAYPSNYRPMRFVLDNQIGSRANFAVTADIRTLAPGASYTVWAELSVPRSMALGQHRLGLWLPDSDPQLSSRPEYSVRLANTGIWYTAAGYNDLRQVTVT